MFLFLFTTTCHFFVFFLHFSVGSGSGNASTRALEITQSIISAHLRRENVLSGDNYHCLKRLLGERIRSERSLLHHDTAAAWCAVYMRLLSDSLDEKEQFAVVSVLRADSLIHTRSYSEAVECSEGAVKVVHSTRTLLMHFKALLHASTDVADAVQTLMQLLYGHTTETAMDTVVVNDEDNHMTTTTTPSALTPTLQLENLSRIILCTYAAQESQHLPSAQRDATTQLLLREWMHHYTIGELWRHQDSPDAMEVVDTNSEYKDTANENTSSNKSYLTVVCNYMHYYLLRRMTYSLNSTTRSGINATDITATTTAAVIDTIAVDESVRDRAAMDTTTAEPTTTSPSPPLVTNSSANVADSGDFFALLGYPDSLQPLTTSTSNTNNGTINGTYNPDSGANGANTTQHLSFACTLDDIKQHFLTVLEEVTQLTTTLEKEAIPLAVLGDVNDLTWLAHLAYNIALVLLKMPQLTTNRTNNTDSATKETSFASQMLLTARLFELCEYFLAVKANSPIGASTSDTYDRATCYLAACAARIDAEKHLTNTTNATTTVDTTAVPTTTNSNLFTPFTNHSNNTSPNTTTIIPSNNLITARLNAQKAERLLTLHNDFQDTIADNMRCVALQQEFAVLCIMPDPKLCASFVKERAADFLKLSVTDLTQCAHTAQQNHTISVDVTRTLLNLALQRGVRDVCPDYSILGTVYRELIELSPSRRAALEKVEEFTQMAMTLAHSRGNATADNNNTTTDNDTNKSTTTSFAGLSTTTNSTSVTTTKTNTFLSEDIDHIVSLAFNYGVTLGDLDQPALAERFISKAIALLTCASPVVKAWLPKMQVRKVFCACYLNYYFSVCVQL